MTERNEVTTNCDLEEMKHIAQQKFIELVDSGVEWKKSTLYSNAYRFGPWIAGSHRRFGVLTLNLSGEEVWRRYPPDPQETVEFVIGKDGKSRHKQTKERKTYEKALDAFEADPMVVAIRKIEKVHTDRECEKRRQEMKSALESSCKALQEALKDTATTLAPLVQTGNTEPYSKPQGQVNDGPWETWFAWYPVPVSGSLVWFRSVSRKRTYWRGGEDWSYRL